jgi:HD-GYP domain-containing protein (c-di-GMP phosphodiesterase class II)
MSKLAIREKTRKRCLIVPITPEMRSRLHPVNPEIFPFLYFPDALPFSLYARIGDELVEYIPKGAFDKKYLDELGELLRKSRDDCEVCIKRGERPAFDALIQRVRAEKLANLRKTLPNLDQKTLDIYSALSTASQMVVAGGIDTSVISQVKASATYLVSNVIDSELTVSTLGRMITCDPTLYDHSATVTMISAVISTKLLPKKFSKKEAEVVAQSAMFHDVGKTCVPSEILNKPGKLTPEEFEIMKKHTTLGHQELKQLIAGGAPIDEIVARVALEHHEKWDGRGYPSGRKGAWELDSKNGIHIVTRIVTIADIYSALLMKRVYKPAFEPQDALKIMASESKGFDPDIFMAFLKCVVRSLNAEQKNQASGRILAIGDDGVLKEWQATPKSAS